MLEIKGRLLRQVMHAVAEYFDAFGKPVPLKVLSARFNKALSKAGGFAEGLEELQRDGSIDVVLSVTGAKLVFPAGKARLSTENQAILKR
jgi:hypothetical protein